MDKRSKVVIGALIVFGLLYAFGLGSTLVPKKDEDKGPGSYQSSWLDGMDRLIQRFSPRLDPQRLQPEAACNKQPDGSYRLTSGTPCNIRIARDTKAKDDYQTATLLIRNAATINVPCPPKNDTTTERGAPALLRFKPAIVMQPKPIVAIPAGATLMVVYTPEGKSAEAPACPGKNEVRLVAGKAGGTLTLQCSGCSTSRFVELGFKK